ncbi:hypothetical protein [uncultured Duncaniella sp.]|uniref:hypothetical protein n=1 Tax=uncultured Duncaniella sp. TaxID=2768039 RepID=UPI00260B7D5B|nr:hypothetical protein [uncultured Duncaniella sp.]
MICGPQWSQGGLGEHRHPAGQIDVTDTTTLPDELDALKSADTQLGSQLTELSSKVEQAGGDKIGDIKVSVRTDLGDDWCLCNGDPIPDEYPELVQISGGLQLSGKWTPLTDFKTNLSGQDYFVHDGELCTIQNTTIDGRTGIYLLKIVNFEVDYIYLGKFTDTNSYHMGWAYMNGILYVAEMNGYAKRVYIHSAAFSLDGKMSWSSRTISLWTLWNISYADYVDMYLTYGFTRSATKLYLTSVDGYNVTVSMWDITASTPVKLTLEWNSALGNSSKTRNLFCCYYWFYNMLEICAYQSTSYKCVMLWYNDTYVGGTKWPERDCTSYSWTVLDNYIYWTSRASGVTNIYKYRLRLTDGSHVNTLAENSQTPYDVFQYDGNYYMLSNDRICQVTSTASAPYFSLDEGVSVSGYASSGKGVFFVKSNCYITGTGIKCTLLPSISLSDTAYTYIKRK